MKDQDFVKKKHEETVDDYEALKQKIQQLSIEFLKDFKTELDKVFDLEEGTTYQSHYVYLESTGGFEVALETASKKHGLTQEIFENHEEMDWETSDDFDHLIVKRMVELGIIKG